MLRGVAASSGIGIGNALLVYSDDLVVSKHTGRDPCREKYRFLQATEKFISEINEAGAIIEKRAGREEADILRTQTEIASDPELCEEITSILEEHRINLEYAFATVCDRYIKLFSEIENEFLRARTADFIDFRDHLLTILTGKKKIDFSGAPRGSVIVAHDIAPSSAASIDPGNIVGILTQSGNAHSHISIIARAMGLPAIVAINGLFEQVRNGDTLVVDGDVGEIVSNPDIARLHRYRSYYSILH